MATAQTVPAPLEQTPGKRRWLLYPAVSLLLLAPCYWQPQLRAGDLSGLIYNGWITSLVENGRTQGLQSSNWTNLLFDWILRALFHLLGPEPAARITVSIAVLIFAWGAFAFVSTVAKSQCWHLMPSIAVLAYGWVFHMGLFDFYLSLGLCFWAMAVAWDPGPRRMAMALPIFGLAFLSHALPVIWTFGLMTYVTLARPLTPKRRAMLTANFVLLTVLCYLVVGKVMSVQWSTDHHDDTFGIRQAASIGGKYLIVLIGQAAVWSFLFLAMVRKNGARQVVTSIPFLLCVVGATAVIALPATLLIPDFYHGLRFVGERMSLGVAVCVCALLGSVRPRVVDRWALATVSLAFFIFVYGDQRAATAQDDPMQDVISLATTPALPR